MKKIVDEIIGNTPELEQDKNKLSKTVDFLDENNPKLSASKEFKASLKNRLKSLIALKQNKKSRFAIFAIPVFSAMFVVAGFFYYFDDVDLIQNPNVKLKQVTRISEQEFQAKEINEIGEMFEEELQNVIDEEKADKAKALNLKEIQAKELESDEIHNQPKNIQRTSIVPEIENNTQEDVQMIDQLIEEDIESENDQILEIFEALEEEYGEEFNTDVEVDNIDGKPENSILKGAGTDMDIDMNEIESSAMQLDMVLTDESQINFTQYCENEGGEISGTGELEKCIVDKNECLASQFENGVCEFSEIK